MIFKKISLDRKSQHVATLRSAWKYTKSCKWNYVDRAVRNNHEVPSQRDWVYESTFFMRSLLETVSNDRSE